MASVPRQVRQAVVIVHGMGEQRPLDMLNRFIAAAIPGTHTTQPPSGNPVWYSRPDPVSDSYESRRYLAPATPDYAHTEFFEYHWAHLMQGNKLGDMWSTFRRMLLQLPWRVPDGLRGIWLIFWVIIIGVLWYLLSADLLSDDLSVNNIITTLITTLVGGGLTATLLTWALTKFLPGKISSSFVDVVRYLDTSPRSYGVRKAIRKGMIEFLQSLHKSGRYQRIIIVAHSLGSYIAYDGICYLWTQMNQKHCAPQNGPMDSKVRQTLEDEADALLNKRKSDPAAFRAAQRELWKELRKQGNPWLITDFITLGSPMYMADQLLTRNRADLEAKINLRQFASCPPQPDLPGPTAGKTLYTYPYHGGPVLYHAAPFAVVRWTNIWFPAIRGFFGDWFGGPLSGLFGNGIRDIALSGNRPKSVLPALPHTLYFAFPDDESSDSATRQLHEAMELDSNAWLAATLNIPACPK